jgi:hypothetical protein
MYTYPFRTSIDYEIVVYKQILKICFSFSLNAILFEASCILHHEKFTGLVVCVPGTAVLFPLFENLRAIVIKL